MIFLYWKLSVSVSWIVRFLNEGIDKKKNVRDSFYSWIVIFFINVCLRETFLDLRILVLGLFSYQINFDVLS